MPVDHAEGRLPNPYRSLRHVSAGGDAPWSGAVAQGPDGARVLLVDSIDLPAHWPGWSAGVDDHVVAPIDIVRTRSTHLVVLPMCATRLEDVLDRRAASGTALSAGETVTVCVSVLRGLSAVRRLGIVESAQWWIDDSGRPLLALGVGSDPAEAACARVLEHLSPTLDASTLRSVRELCDDPRASVFRFDTVEEMLFALAPAEPLAQAVFPVRTPGSAFDAVLAPRPAVPSRIDADPVADDVAGSATPWVARLARHIDADVADHVSRVTTAAWRALRSERAQPTASRRGAWGVAAAAAVLVVGFGMLWPGDETGAAHESPAAGDTTAGSTVLVSPAATDEPGDAPGVSPDAEADAARIVDALLSARTECGSDRECAANLLADPATILTPGIIDLPADRRSVHVVDDFGGVAVVRVDADGARSQLVVIERREGRWLLRDAYDIAQQP